MTAVLTEKKVAYISAPKVASTTVKYTLYKHVSGYAENDNGRQPNFHTIFPSLHFVDTKLPQLTNDGYWTFTIVRDPIKRLLAAYQNRVIERRSLEKSCKKSWKTNIKRKVLGLEVVPDINTFFRDLNRYRICFKSIRDHTDPISIYIGNNLDIYSKVYNLEDLNKLRDDLAEKLSDPLISLSNLKGDGIKRDWSELTEKNQNYLLKFTQSDYKMLHGRYQPPIINSQKKEN